MRLLTALTIAATLAAGSASAAPCRDAKGKFIKCATAPAAASKCRDAKGHFAKCGAPGTHPA